MLCECGGSLKYKEIPPGREAKGTWKRKHAGDLIRNLVDAEMAEEKLLMLARALIIRERRERG